MECHQSPFHNINQPFTLGSTSSIHYLSKQPTVTFSHHRDWTVDPTAWTMHYKVFHDQKESHIHTTRHYTYTNAHYLLHRLGLLSMPDDKNSIMTFLISSCWDLFYNNCVSQELVMLRRYYCFAECQCSGEGIMSTASLSQPTSSI